MAKDSTEGGAYMFSKLLKDRTNYVRLEYKKALAGYTINGCSSSGSGESATRTCPGGVTEPPATNATFFFNDGIMFTYQLDAEKCTKSENTTVEAYAKTDAGKKCLGYIDVNGIKGPNKAVACDSGSNTNSKPCTVTNPTDIYPVVFFDQSVLPATEAAKTVLYGK